MAINGDAVKLGVSGLAVILGMSFFAASSIATEQGGQRRQARDTRQDARQESRTAKADCRADNQKNNAECRQDKRNTKQDARQQARDIKY